VRKLILFGAGILLASCARGGVAPLPATQTAQAFAPLLQPAADSSYRLLYSFKDGNDGGYPFAGLTVLNGELYGTTYGGGGPSSWGTVFKIGPTGDEKVIYKFKAGDDGAHPYGNLIALDGTLYGTTYQGGSGGYGTVFKVTPAGEEHVLYSFNNGADGGYPYGSLVALDGMLYGTTYQGGAGSGWGTVFKLVPRATSTRCTSSPPATTARIRTQASSYLKARSTARLPKAAVRKARAASSRLARRVTSTSSTVSKAARTVNIPTDRWSS
jgi:uncharacterized repeat protein (TIGR03803 family)